MNEMLEGLWAKFDKVSRTLKLTEVIEVSLYIAGAGAFGVFLRWMQDQLAFNEAGLPEKSAFHVIVPLYLLLAAYVLHGFVRRYGKRGLSVPDDFFAAFSNHGGLYTALRWGVGGLMMLSGLVTFMTTELDKYAGMLRILAILAMLSGLAFALLLHFAERGSADPRLRPVMTMKTSVSQVKTIGAGDSVSYGRTFRAADSRSAALAFFSASLAAFCSALRDSRAAFSSFQ